MPTRLFVSATVWIVIWLFSTANGFAPRNDRENSPTASLLVAELVQRCSVEVRSQTRERCDAVLRRLGLGIGRRRLGNSSQNLAKIAWGMPGCPIEKKFQDGEQQRCNNAAISAGLFPRAPLVMYMVDDAMNWQHFSTNAMLSCPVSCLFVGHVSPPAVPDALVFDCLQDPRTMRDKLAALGDEGPRGVLRVFLCMESEANLPRTRDPRFLQQFDIVATYRLGATVPLLYAPGNLSLYDYAETEGGRKEGLVVWVASNCAQGRVNFVRSLMQLVAVDSYGKCLHNRGFPDDAPLAFSSAKIPLFARYKFALALENSVADDYVTEKFYQPLIAGAVPLYLGAPNVEAFAPAPDAFVDLRSFESVQAVAAFLLYLDGNHSAYQELHAWRRRALPAHFEAQARLAFNQGTHYGEMDMRQDPCRICEAASARLARQT